MSRPVLWCVLCAWGVLGTVTYSRAGVWQSELSLWTDAAAKAPQKPRPWINLGLAREVAGDMEGALLAHQTALALAYQPRLTQYQQRFSALASETNIARILAQTGREEAALRMLNDVITKAPLFAHAHYNRGVLLARTGRCDEGVREAQVAIALDASFQEFACAPGSR